MPLSALEPLLSYRAEQCHQPSQGNSENLFWVLPMTHLIPPSNSLVIHKQQFPVAVPWTPSSTVPQSFLPFFWNGTCPSLFPRTNIVKRERAGRPQGKPHFWGTLFAVLPGKRREANFCILPGGKITKVCVCVARTVPLPSMACLPFHLHAALFVVPVAAAHPLWDPSLRRMDIRCLCRP